MSPAKIYRFRPQQRREVRAARAGLVFFGEIIEVRRTDLKISRSRLGAAVGVCAQTIFNWERGRLKRLPPPHRYNALCAALRLGRLDVFNNCEYVRKFELWRSGGGR